MRTLATGNDAKALLDKGAYASAMHTHAANSNLEGMQSLTEMNAELQKVVNDTLEAPPERPAATLPTIAPHSSRPVESVAVADARLTRIRFVNGFTSAAILSVIAWVAFRKMWTGTVDDFVKVAVLAFFSDFTLQAVVDAVGKLKAADPAGGAPAR